MPRKHRSDADYEISSLRNGMRVLAALADAPVRGYAIRDVEHKTGLSHDFCMRALRTLALDNYARELKTGWILAPATAALSDRLIDHVEEKQS